MDRTLTLGKTQSVNRFSIKIRRTKRLYGGQWLNVTGPEKGMHLFGYK